MQGAHEYAGVGITEWHNPLDHDRKVRVLDNPGEYITLVFPAGKTVAVPSKFDFAIHQLSGKPGDENRAVIGGGDPFLKRKNGPQYPLHSSYMPAQKTPEQELMELKIELASIKAGGSRLDELQTKLAESESQRARLSEQLLEKQTAPKAKS